jgi:hypothetical protein
VLAYFLSADGLRYELKEITPDMIVSKEEIQKRLSQTNIIDMQTYKKSKAAQ